MARPLRLCFILEEQYRRDRMPLCVADVLAARGHRVEVVEPFHTVTAVSELEGATGGLDAFVLKTLSDGPGLSLLEAAAAAGQRTINDARRIRAVRDKAVASAIARRRGLPVPLTMFLARPELLRSVPPECFPVVVKPVLGCAGSGVVLVESPDRVAEVVDELDNGLTYLAQSYLPNPGVDVKLYCIGSEVFATRQASPLHPDGGVEPGPIPLDHRLEVLARQVGEVYGLDLYGVDVVETDSGWAIVDVNDFPSFHFVPHAPERIADLVERLAGAPAPLDGPVWGHALPWVASQAPAVLSPEPRGAVAAPLPTVPANGRALSSTAVRR